MNDSRMHGEILRTRAADPMDRLRHDEADPNPCPPLTAAEYEALKQSIATNGLLVPVLISAGPACEGQVIDGFHRSQICAELGIVPATHSIPCASDLEFRIRQITTNLERRQLPTVQRARLAARLKPLYEEQTRLNQLAGLKQNGSVTQPVGERDEDRHAREAAAKAAASAGVSRETLRQMEAVMAQAPELLEQIEAGAKSIKSAYQALRTATEQAALDTAIASEATALAEIEETVALMDAETVASTHDDARERAAGEAIRMSIELDRLLQRHAIIPDEIAEYRSRPHTFKGTARRLGDWFASLGDVL